VDGAAAITADRGLEQACKQPGRIGDSRAIVRVSAAVPSAPQHVQQPRFRVRVRAQCAPQPPIGGVQCAQACDC